MEAIDVRTDADRIKALIENFDYEGFGDLDHLLTVPTRSRKRLHDKLARTDRVEGVPFPASLAFVRAIINDETNREVAREARLSEYPGNLRFGVFRQHMTEVKEVSFSELQAGFCKIRFHQDVPSDELGARGPRGDTMIRDWRGFEFYSIPALTSDALWDLYDMDDTPWAKPENALAPPEIIRDPSGETIEAYAPLLVAATRNRTVLDDLRRQRRRVPAIPMSQHGACLHLTLFRIPRQLSGKKDQDLEIQEIVNMNFPILGLGARRARPYLPGESWLVATYQPPPNVRSVPGVGTPGFIGLAATPRDPWTVDLADPGKAETDE